MGGAATRGAQRIFRLACAHEEVSLVEALLRAEGYIFERCSCSALARRLLKQPRPLGSSIAAHFGLIYIQDKASLLPPLLLDPPQGGAVLDMCASPGSKAGLLAQLVGDSGLVVANEPQGKRHVTLRKTMEQLNAAQVVTSRYPGEDFPEMASGLSHILLDVPCSAWGTLDKNPRAATIWRPGRLGPLLALQRRLLERAASLLAPGGSILYSTCTTNSQENEAQAMWACTELGLDLVPLHEPAGFSWREPEAPGSLRVDGAASGCQSFFLACLRKPGSGLEGGSPRRAAEPKEAGPPFDRLLSRNELPLQPHAAWDHLPPGQLGLQGKELFFLPERAAELLGSQLQWKGLSLGKLGHGLIRMNGKWRKLLPRASEKRGLHLEDIEGLRALLSGQSLPAPSREKQVGLYWRDLPLGWLAVKGGRCLWAG
jgi:16S rRNA (cytosine1407-C5)-methyltransferase